MPNAILSAFHVVAHLLFQQPRQWALLLSWIIGNETMVQRG